MTEILRYAPIGKEDLKIGTGKFEVRLGDGTVVQLSEIQLTDFLSSLTTGSVLFVKAGGIAGEDNANLFWDDTNNRLGIGTATPTVQLDMTGAAKIALTLSVVGIILSDANLTFKSGTSFIGTLDHAITAARTWTLPDSTDTIALIALAQTLTNKTILAPSNTVSGVLDRDVTTADVVNTITETTIYSFSVPGGTLGTNRALRLTMIGDYLNNSGASTRFTLRVKYGATIIAEEGVQSIPANIDRRALNLEMVLSAINATNSQASKSIWFIGGVSSVDGTNPLSTFGTALVQTVQSVNNAIAEDSSLAKDLVITFEHQTAATTISARALAVQLEVIL